MAMPCERQGLWSLKGLGKKPAFRCQYERAKPGSALQDMTKATYTARRYPVR